MQVELALSRIVGAKKTAGENAGNPFVLSIWGISATIGNLEQAGEVLLSPLGKKGVIVRADIRKSIEVESIFPDEIETYPWAGHMGLKLIDKIIPIIIKPHHANIY